MTSRLLAVAQWQTILDAGEDYLRLRLRLRLRLLGRDPLDMLSAAFGVSWEHMQVCEFPVDKELIGLVVGKGGATVRSAQKAADEARAGGRRDAPKLTARLRESRLLLDELVVDEARQTRRGARGARDAAQTGAHTPGYRHTGEGRVVTRGSRGGGVWRPPTAQRG